MSHPVPERSNLKQLMKAQKMGDNELSEKIGLPATTIYRLKIGYTADPRLSTLKLLADFFNVTLGQIIGEEPLGPDLLNQDKTDHCGAFFKIPVLHWDMAFDWEKTIASLWTYTDIVSNSKACALKIESTEYAPIFPKDALIFLDGSVPNTYPYYAVVADKHTQRCTIAKIIRGISGDYLLHPENDAIIIPFDNNNHLMLGAILGTQIRY